jgi:hypothetical protein
MSKDFVSSLIGLLVYASSLFIGGHFPEGKSNAFYYGIIVASVAYPFSKGVEKGVRNALGNGSESSGAK